jgi:hypothetical protein
LRVAELKFDVIAGGLIGRVVTTAQSLHGLDCFFHADRFHRKMTLAR